MKFPVICLSILLSLQLVSTGRAHGRHCSCDDVQEELASNNECQEALDMFDVNTTTSDSPLCMRPCHGLVKNLLVKCGEEFVSL